MPWRLRELKLASEKPSPPGGEIEGEVITTLGQNEAGLFTDLPNSIVLTHCIGNAIVLLFWKIQCKPQIEMKTYSRKIPKLHESLGKLATY